MIALKRILVPHDFSETSAASVSFAVALAKSFGAKLDFLYVGDRDQVGLESGEPIDVDAGVAEPVRGRLAAILSPKDREAVRPEFHMRTGHAAAEIVRFAGEHETDLIVMGTHGRGFVGHMVMGSVAEKVVRTAPCPVLTVRTPGEAGQTIEVVPEALDAARAVI
jgi:nucleotide-binding universal stress UspA family protein